MKIKKRRMIFGLLVLLLFVGVFTINASIMHSGHDFELSVDDGNDVTLQGAISGDYFTGSHTYALPSSIPDPGHSFDEIWVSVDGDEKTLQNALLTINGLCGSSSIPYLGPSDKSKAYHYASEIEISPDTSLQDIIDSGDFCCVSHSTYGCDGGDIYWYDSCGVIEEKKTECGTSGYIGRNYCYDNDVYRDYVTIGCSGSSCTSSTSGILQEECDSTSHYCGGRPSQCVAYTYRWKTGIWDTTEWGYPGLCATTDEIHECWGVRNRDVWCEDDYGNNIGTGCDVGCDCANKPATQQGCRCYWEKSSYVGCYFKLFPVWCSSWIGSSCGSYGIGSIKECSEDREGICGGAARRNIYKMVCKFYYEDLD